MLVKKKELGIYLEIFLEQKVHRKIPQLIIKFQYNNALINLLRKTKSVLWGNTLKSWCVKVSKENINTFKNIASVSTYKVFKKEVL